MTLMVCGIVMLSATVIPVSSFIDSGSDTDLQELAEKDAGIIDSFWSSDADELVLHGDALMPSPGYHLEMDGSILTIHSPEGKDYRASVKHECGAFTLGYGEEYTLRKG